MVVAAIVKVAGAAKKKAKENKDKKKDTALDVSGGGGMHQAKSSKEIEMRSTKAPSAPKKKGKINAIGSKRDVRGGEELVASTTEVPGDFDVTLNQLAGMPPGTDVQGVSIGGGGNDALGRSKRGQVPPLSSLSGGTVGETRVDDPVNISATRQAGVDAIEGRTTPIQDPTSETEVPDEKREFPELIDSTPEDTTIGSTGQGAPGFTQGTGGQVNALGTGGVTGGQAEAPPGFETPPPDDGRVPQSTIAESDAVVADDGSILEDTPRAQQDTDASGRVQRPAFWKVALDAVFGGMPLIPGSKLATIPLARAREDYYKQDKRDQELTDTFLKEMGEGDWDNAKQLSKTKIFRDAVTRTMNMTPDDLINLDQQIQENSTESLNSIFKSKKLERYAKVAATKGARMKPGQTFDPQGDDLPLISADRPSKEVGGIIVEQGDDGKWTSAFDANAAKQNRRLKQVMDAGYTEKEANLYMLTEGTGMPRFKGIKVGDTGLVMVDQFSGKATEYNFKDMQKANMAMEIFEDEFGVAVGYVMYDKNKGAPTDMSKVTPIFFKNMLWGDQSKGRYTYYDAMRGRVMDAKEKGTSWNPITFLMNKFKGVTVTDMNKATPGGDEFNDYSQGGQVSTQPAPPQKVEAQPVVPRNNKASSDQQSRANSFISETTGINPAGNSTKKRRDLSA